MIIKRGEIYYVELGGTIGSEQSGVRPCLIAQNNIGNRYSTTTIVIPITTKNKKSNMPVHVEISKQHGMPEDSVILCEQIRAVDTRRLKQKITELDEVTMKRVNEALKFSLDIDNIVEQRQRENRKRELVHA